MTLFGSRFSSPAENHDPNFRATNLNINCFKAYLNDTMILDHANGRVVQAHEDYLEQQAQKEANDERKLYIDQIDIYNLRSASVSTAEVQIIVDQQHYKTLYCEREGDGEYMEALKRATSYTISTTIDRNTLRTCSTLADEHFTYNPSENELHLPVCYPRQHHANRDDEPIAVFDENFEFTSCRNGKRLAYQNDDQMAFIRPEEIEKYIVPWLKRVQKQLQDDKALRSETPAASEAHAGSESHTRVMKKTPKRTKLARYLVRTNSPMAIGIPEALVDKIHLYNAMLQLGLPKFVQLPLIDALVLQMDQTRLSACQLDTLEHTIGRFYSRGIAVLDPVLNHFIGTYSSRSLDDRTKPEPSGRNAKLADNTDAAEKEPATETPQEASIGSKTGQATNEEPTDNSSETVDKEKPQPALELWKTKRKYLEYYDFPAQRIVYTLDTYLLPPKLPVLGHSIRHWSGVRRNQSIAAAYTSFPLNIRKHKKFIRRNVTNVINANDRFEEETNK
jgi:hypothetical protein